MKEACPAAAGGRQDKPSPDSGCSLGFSSRLSSPGRPAGDGETDRRRDTGDSETDRLCPSLTCNESLSLFSDSEPTERLSVDGNSSELELEEDEEEGGGGEIRASQLVPQTPDQEAFLKEHFVTLADLAGSGTAGV